MPKIRFAREKSLEHYQYQPPKYNLLNKSQDLVRAYHNAIDLQDKERASRLQDKLIPDVEKKLDRKAGKLEKELNSKKFKHAITKYKKYRTLLIARQQGRKLRASEITKYKNLKSSARSYTRKENLLVEISPKQKYIDIAYAKRQASPPSGAKRTTPPPVRVEFNTIKSTMTELTIKGKAKEKAGTLRAYM